VNSAGSIKLVVPDQRAKRAPIRDPYVDDPLLARGGKRFLIEAIAVICPVC
jgi:hypothetical protein